MGLLEKIKRTRFATNIIAESYLEEDRALEKVIAEKVNEHAKIAAHRRYLCNVQSSYC